MTEKQKLSRLRITHARVGALILVVACTEMKSCCFEETSRGFGEPPITAVVTQHNDNARTGANLGILGLTVTSVSSGQFQRIFSFPVVGQIYAQPLYIPAVKDPAGVERNLLVVSTMQNMLYVFDADAAVHKTGATATPLMSVPLGPPVPFNYMPMAEATFMVGSTPITWMIPSG